MVVACRKSGGFGWLVGKIGQMWKSCPCDLPSSSPLPPLPAFSLLRVTLEARSPVRIGCPPPSSPLIGWAKSLLHYRNMATALPAIRDDWKKWLRKFTAKKGLSFCPRNWSMQTIRLVSKPSNFLCSSLKFTTSIHLCHLYQSRSCLMPSIISKTGCFSPRNWFVAVLKMHHCL